jgi:23S rRNA pseudouridine2605 synthase
MTDETKQEAGDLEFAHESNEIAETAPEPEEAAGASAESVDAGIQEETVDREQGEDDAADAAEKEAEPKPAPKLERLQKILAQAGVASRRHAEEMITQGRVQVNGQVVTELGSKADAGRDHIRVDGKLLQGAERQRYFVLNKPRGFVTTVSDPEGRPTVMQFFQKMRERLYPVGRLDYLSEGLLLVTNDGELANKLTRASAGVEKTYLVKVAGQPTESELDVLRGGVAIDRKQPGSGKVRTSPARIRQVRQGDNPWYEVVLTEGRNRELRKMFEEIGHFVEKIRRVGYGPLVLDQEPGNLRELEPQELDLLRKAAEGKPVKTRDKRRGTTIGAELPTVAPKPSRIRPPVTGGERTGSAPRGEFRPKFGAERPVRPAGGEGFRPAAGRAEGGPARFGQAKSGPAKFGPPKRDRARPAWKKDDRPARPAWKKDDRTERPAARFGAGPARESRPGADRGGSGTGGRGGAGDRRTFGAKPAWNRGGSAERPAFNRSEFKRPGAPRRDEPSAADRSTPPKPIRLQIDAIENERSGTDRPSFPRSSSPRPSSPRSSSPRPSFSRPGPGRPMTGRPSSGDRGADRPQYDKPKSGFGKPRFDKPRFDKPKFAKPGFDKPRFEKAGFDKPRGDRPSGGPGRTGAGAFGRSRPARGEGGLARPFTTSSGKPRAGGARPSSKPSKPGAWKPKAGSGGAAKPGFAGRSKPAYGAKSGGFSKPGSDYKAKPGSGGKRTGGPRPGGKRPGAAPRGKKRD